MNDKGKVEIDYILLQPSSIDLVRSVTVKTQNDSKTSDHISVTIALKLIVATIDKKPVVVRDKPKWDKCNIPLYTSHISRQPQPFNSPQTDYEFVLSLGHIASTLKNSVRASFLDQKDSRKIYPIKDRVCYTMQNCEHPENCEHSLVQQMKQCKRTLRKAQRQTEAKRRAESS